MCLVILTLQLDTQQWMHLLLVLIMLQLVEMHSLATNNNDNIAIGHAALAQSSVNDGDCNIAIGKTAMGAADVSGDYNVAIGRNAMNTITGGGDNIAIGQDAMLSSVDSGIKCNRSRTFKTSATTNYYNIDNW